MAIKINLPCFPRFLNKAQECAEEELLIRYRDLNKKMCGHLFILVYWPLDVTYFHPHSLDYLKRKGFVSF